jgi:hypothetical protein
MAVIAQRVWREPAVFIGLLTAIAIAVLKITTGAPWDAATIAAIPAPLVAALGIRQLVTPTAKPPAA